MSAGLPDSLTPAVVEQAIRASRPELDARVRALDGRAIGIGALADTFLLTPEWEQGGPAGADDPDGRPGAGPVTLVAKVPSSDPQAAATANSLGAYEREVRFYEELAPRTDLSVPAFLGAFDVGGTRSGLFLEDLSVLVPGDQMSDTPLPLLRRAREQLVALQAPFWDDRDVGALDWLHRRQGVPIPGIHERMQRSWAVAGDRIAGDFDPAERAAIDRFVAVADGWAGSLDGPFTLSHHDFRMDNLLIGRDPERVVVLDWQTVGWGAPMFDVAYLLGTSESPSVRARIERDEIARHVDDLAARGVVWPVDDAWSAYRRASFAILLMLVPPTGSVKQSARTDAMYRRLLRHGARMVLDLDATEFLGA